MPSAWVAHVKKYYADRKKKEPGYKYKNAMKDARKTYVKAGAKPAKTEEKKPDKPKRRRKKRVPKDFTKKE